MGVRTYPEPSEPGEAVPVIIAFGMGAAFALWLAWGLRMFDAEPTVRPPRDLYTPEQRLEQERHCEAECYPEAVTMWQAKICVCESGDKSPGFEVAQ